MYGNRHPVLERTVEEGFLYTLIIYAFCFSLLSLGLAGRRDTSHMRACMRDTCSRQPHAASCRRAGSCSVGVRGRGWTRRVERLERDHDLRSLLAPQCAAGAAPKLRTKSPGATMNKTIGTQYDYLNFLWRLVRRTPAPRGPGLAERDTTRACVRRPRRVLVSRRVCLCALARGRVQVNSQRSTFSLSVSAS